MSRPPLHRPAHGTAGTRRGRERAPGADREGRAGEGPDRRAGAGPERCAHAARDGGVGPGTGRRVRVAPGRSLFVRSEGSGPAVLVLHGFTGCGESMAGVARALAGRARVLRVDLLGHGRSDAPGAPDVRSRADAPRSPYRMERAVSDLVALLDAEGEPAAHVVGYSLGARVALALGVAAPSRVRSLALLGGRAGIEDPAERAARRRADEALAAAIETRGLAWFVDHWMALPLFATQRRLGPAFLGRARAARLRNRPHGLANSLRGVGAGAQPPLFDALGTLDRPVWLAAGAQDPKFAGLARDLARRLPRARVHLVPGAGHAAHMESPDAFAAALLAFLEGEAGLAARPFPHPPGQEDPA